jgi:hypothetical protein
MGGKKQALKLEYDKKMNLCIALIIYHTKKKKLIQVTCDISRLPQHPLVRYIVRTKDFQRHLKHYTVCLLVIRNADIVIKMLLYDY